MTILKNECLHCKVRNCSILHACDEETLKSISTFKLPKTLKKGKKLFSEGDAIEGVCFIKKGFLKVELNGKEGRPLILKIAGTGDVVGHKLYNQQTQHTNSATAVTDVQYCFIPGELFDTISGKSQILKEEIIAQYLGDMEVIKRKALSLAQKSVREKVAEALLLLAETYQYDTTSECFRISIDRLDLANLVGTSKEQISRTLKEFSIEGIIQYSAKTFSYLNIKQLQIVSGCN